MRSVLDTLNWVRPHILFIRLHDVRERGYREWVLTDAAGEFVRFQRVYDTPEQLARVVLTADADVAQIWQNAQDARTAWRRIKRFTRKSERATLSVEGSVFNRFVDHEVADCVRTMVSQWKRPDSTVGRATKLADGWRDPAAVHRFDRPIRRPGLGRRRPDGFARTAPSSAPA